MKDSRAKNDDWVIELAAKQGFFARGRASIIVIYALLGPPIGGLLTILIQFSDNLASNFSMSAFNDDFISTVFGLLTLPLAAAVWGYLFGGVQALATGLLLAALSGANGGFGYLKAIIAPAIVGAAAGLFLVSIQGQTLEFATFLCAIGIAASLILRFLFRRRFISSNVS